MTRWIISLIALAALVGVSSCTGGSGLGRSEVVVYVSVDEMFSRPILDDFARATGIHVAMVTDQEAAKTTGLMNKLIALKERPEADVFWNNESMRSVILARKGVLEPYVPTAAADIPARFKAKDGAFAGFAARARVILYNTSLVKEEAAPRSILDFEKPEWRDRFAVSNPLFGSSSTHVATLFAALGPERAEALLRGWKENGCRIVAGNALARNLVANGEIAACLTDTDDANEALLDGRPVKMVYPDQDGMGTVLLPSSAVLVKGGPNPSNGRRLVDYLASRDVEARLAKARSAQIPLRPGIEPFSEEFDLARIKVLAVDQERAADMLERSTRFVEETFIR